MRIPHPFLLLSAFVAFACPVGAVEFNDATLALLKSNNRSDRARVYASMAHLTPEETTLGVRQLREAWDFHKAAVARAVMDAAAGQNSWGTFLKEREEWRTGVEALLKDIHTDWHKDPKKIAELTRDMDRCAKLRERLRRAADTAEKGDFARLLASCATLIEIDQQVANATATGSTFKPNAPATLLRAVAEFPEMSTKVKGLADFRAAENKYSEAETWNAAQRWAGADQKRFATVLNQHRLVVAYQPLRLDEKLCAASTGHSVEMVQMKYFSHESPVPENKTFGDRAKNAAFDGFASGECIFAGSRSADAAYGAWWASDGHRFIMFMEGANTMGIGAGGTESWTFNTGSKTWPAAAPTAAAASTTR